MSRKRWYRAIEPPPEQHPVDLEVQERLKDNAEYQALRAQILELVRALSQRLDGESRDVWLEVEAALNDRWALVAETYYDAGVDAGLAKRIVSDILADARVGDHVDPAVVVRALAAALAEIAEALD